MLWGRGNVPATPGQLRALLEDPLKKKLIYQLWTAQALSKLGEDDPEDASPLSDLTARQLVMIDEAAEAIDRECIPYDVDELATRPPSPPPPQHHLSPRTIIDRGEGQGEGQAAPGEDAPDEEAIQRRRVAEERRYRLVVELRRRSDEEAERQSAAAVSMERDRLQATTPTCMPSCTAPPPPPTPARVSAPRTAPAWRDARRAAATPGRSAGRGVRILGDGTDRTRRISPGYLATRWTSRSRREWNGWC